MRNEEVLIQVVGRDSKIASIVLQNNVLVFTFEDGNIFNVWDNGQDCCESRYFTCDDDLPAYIGDKLVSVELKEHRYEEAGEVHEIQFIEVQTSKGVFSVCAHNEHNGYYGGFGICYS